MAQDQTDQALSQDLVDTLPGTINDLDSSIENINEQLGFLQDDLVGVSAVMSMMTTAASAWMFEKAFELDATYKVEVSGGWGNTNLTEWGIIDPAAPIGGINYNQYLDSDVISGSPSAAETQQFNRHIDFPLGLVHMNKDQDLTGTYGINAKIDNLNTTLGLQTANRDAYKGFLKAYSRNI